MYTKLWKIRSQLSRWQTCSQKYATGYSPSSRMGLPVQTPLLPVEGQEVAVLAVQLRAHLDFAVRHGEMNDGTPLEGQQGLHTPCCLVLWQAIVLVLLDGGFRRLCEVSLDLHGGHGQSVDEEHQVDGQRAAWAILELGHDAQDVGVVALPGGRVALVLGQAFAKRNLTCAGHLDPLAQHVDRALAFQGLAQAIHEGGGCLVAIARLQLLPFLGLCRLHPLDQILRVLGVVLVVARGVTHLPAACFQLLDDVLLEVLLAVGGVGEDGMHGCP